MANGESHRSGVDVAATPDVVTSGADNGIGAKFFARLNQFYCGLHGHDRLIQFEKSRMFLRCVSRGHESPGWTFTQAPPRLVFRGDARRRVRVRPRFVTARRIA